MWAGVSQRRTHQFEQSDTFTTHAESHPRRKRLIVFFTACTSSQFSRDSVGVPRICQHDEGKKKKYVQVSWLCYSSLAAPGRARRTHESTRHPLVCVRYSGMIG